MTRFLSNAPHGMLREAIENGHSWNTFEAKLLKRYLPVDHREVIFEDVTTLKQKGSFQVYLDKFLYLIDQLRDLSEHDKVIWFKKG